MKQYLLYGGILLFIIYIVNRLSQYILYSVDQNENGKKLLLKLRRDYKDKIFKFKKLYNEIKILDKENNELKIKYDNLRTHNFKTQEFCNNLGRNLNETGQNISNEFKNKIIPIYKDYEPQPLSIGKRFLNNNSVLKQDYYNELIRKKSKINDLKPFRMSIW
tara:strand:+ start:295 stop:780 length:486 start_codon:yes stop_codon:yes gene_type:complete